MLQRSSACAGACGTMCRWLARFLRFFVRTRGLQPIEPVHPLVIHRPALAFQHHLDALVAEAPAVDLRDLAHPQRRRVLRAAPVAATRPPQEQDLAGAPLADLVALLEAADAHAYPRVSEFFCQHVLEYHLIEGQVGDQPLEPAVLLLELLHPSELGDPPSRRISASTGRRSPR